MVNQNSNEDKDNKSSSNNLNPEHYLRIGTRYLKKVLVPNPKLGTSEYQFKKWSKETIKDDVAIQSPIPMSRSEERKALIDFLSQTKICDSFAMYPDFKNYREIIHTEHMGIASTAFNLCKPLQHDWKNAKGDFPTIRRFLKHLFGDSIDMILDCYRLKLQKPTQLLPVICLVSKEQGTGKTTILKFNYDLFGSNATVIGKEHLENGFNTTFADKLVIGVDENFIEIEKKASKERIKRLATDDKIFYHPKGVDPTQIDYYGWLWFNSNNEHDFMKIEESDTRFWIVKVRSIPKEKKDPNLRQKMLKEIPAFIKYCMTTKVIHPQKSRIWFDTDLIITEQMKTIIEHTRERIDKAIEDTIKEVFTTYQCSEFKISLKALTKLINEDARYKFDKYQIRDWLKIKKGLQLSRKTMYFKYPNGWEDLENDKIEDNITYTSGRAKTYTFVAKDWLNVQEYSDLEQQNCEQIIMELED